MKKLKMPNNCRDGETHLDNVNNERIIPGKSLYTSLESEIDNYLKDEETAKFRKTLENVHAKFIKDEKELTKNNKRFMHSNFHKYALAASLALLIGVFGIVRIINNSSESVCQKIFAQYYQPYHNDLIKRSDHIVINNLYLAFQAYDNHEYEKAKILFTKVIEADESLLMAYLYRGISCIETNDFNNAIASFNKVLKTDSNPYYIQARWYSALAWLKLNNPSIAKQHLTWLSANSRYYGNMAKEILKKLN